MLWDWLLGQTRRLNGVIWSYGHRRFTNTPMYIYTTYICIFPLTGYAACRWIYKPVCVTQSLRFLRLYFPSRTTIVIHWNKSKVLSESHGSEGGADLGFLNPQPLRNHGHGASISRDVPVYSQLVLNAPTHGGMARLSWPGWLVTHRDGLPVYRQSPIQVQLTAPDVE